MANSIFGVAAYQQVEQNWKKETGNTSKSDKVSGKSKAETSQAVKDDKTSEIAGIKTKAWTPIDTTSSLVPKLTDSYGYAIGDVELSDGAKDYYDKLKGKFQNADFILVSKDMKAQVQANAAAYGNANKMVVLIDEEKLERMATDESFRKKYEGIISMAQQQLANAKNSLTSSGASVKNFGMSVDSNGKSEFFATLEKSSDAQAKRIEEKAKAKKEQKAKDQKKAEKKAREEKLDKAREKRKAEKEELTEKLSGDDEQTEEIQADNKEYIELRADSLDELVRKVQTLAYDNSARNVQTDAERAVGQNIDFRG